MSSQQKRGFRLPWAAERSTEEGGAAATLEADSADPTTSAQIEDGVGGELGEGPFQLADAATPDASMDASPEVPEVPESSAEAAMIDTETTTDETVKTAEQNDWDVADQSATADAPTGEQDTPATAEPVARADAEPAARASIKVESGARSSRSNPLVAGLVKAMREAALASREETTGRLNGDATAQMELIREAGTTQAADLRKRADEDIASIRDWSKSEIARIKQETDERIESRRAELEGQTQRHEANVERQVEQVQKTVAAYELDMDRFFEKLLAENDPAKLAALAEQAPEAPDLAGELEDIPDDAPVVDEASGVDPAAMADDTDNAASSEWDDVAWGAVDPARLAAIADPLPEFTTEASGDSTDEGTDAATAEATDEVTAEATDEVTSEMTAEATSTESEATTEPTADATVEPAEGLEAEAAAEAEIASTEGLQIPSNEVWPTSVLAAARRTLHTQNNDFEAAGIANTRLFVNGLTSVAGISAFKGALGQLAGVRSVSVSSGQPGVFIFTVVHSPDTDLQDGIAGLTAFSARVTEASGGELTVVAQEPAA